MPVTGWSVRCLRPSSTNDIGKVGIPDHILNKPGKLTAEEFAIIRNHSRIGGEAVEGVGMAAGLREDQAAGGIVPQALAAMQIWMEAARLLGGGNSSPMGRDAYAVMIFGRQLPA